MKKQRHHAEGAMIPNNYQTHDISLISSKDKIKKLIDSFHYNFILIKIKVQSHTKNSLKSIKHILFFYKVARA